MRVFDVIHALKINRFWSISIFFETCWRNGGQTIVKNAFFASPSLIFFEKDEKLSISLSKTRAKMNGAQ